MASTTRNLSSSLKYRLWQLLYQDGWFCADEGLALSPVDGVPRAYGIQNGYPWVFWDQAVKNPSRNHITVYRNGVVVSPAAYVVNFDRGYVQFKQAVTGAITADLTHFTVNLTEGFPDDAQLLAAALPVVSFSVGGKGGRPFAIGGDVAEWTYPIEIDVLARNDGEAKDLMDGIAERMRRVPLLDCSDAWLLGTDGDVNPNFNFDLAFVGGLRIDPYPRGRLLDPRRNATDKERHPALVTLSVKNVA